MADPLDVFQQLESCPDCGCLTQIGSLRCPECGSFHSVLDSLPERDPPPPSLEPPKRTDIDPTLYSLNPKAELPTDDSEEEELPDPTTNWGDSSTNFAFDDSKEVESLKKQVAEAEDSPNE